MPPRRRTATPRAARVPTRAGWYRDFVIGMRRLDARKVGVTVDASPGGRLDRLVTVVFPGKEVATIHGSFLASFAGNRVEGGRMLITLAQASTLGQRLAEILFPPEVAALFVKSLTSVVRNGSGGLRIRLAMDPALMDLPWEYVCRPDRPAQNAISDFLLLDPAISMVRHAADASVTAPDITGQQRLAFIGTFWEGKRDAWEVGREFALLSDALSPVEDYIRPEFSVAGATRSFDSRALGKAAIFHYAGHTDFDEHGRAYLVKELPTSRAVSSRDVMFLDELGPRLAKSGTRLAVMSACNSGYAAAADPILHAGVPVVVGVNGGVASISTIEFCAKLYESLAVGLTIDEAVVRARLHVLEWGATHDLFDWGLFMVHMVSPDAVLFSRTATPALARKQRTVRAAQAETVGSTLQLARQMDGLNFGEIMSELTKRRVLILGRFTGRRLAVLKALKVRLEEHANGYLPELFTFAKPKSRDLVEAIIGFAALSRFVIADLSEPRSVQSELEAIAPHFQSVPIVPVINRTGREYATFDSIRRRVNVVQPTIRYRDVDDLLEKLDTLVVPRAEAKLTEVRPG